MRHLPPDGALGRRLEPTWWWWHPAHDLLAALVELAAQRTSATDYLRRTQHAAHLRGKPPNLDAVHLPRPWDPPAAARRPFAQLIDRADDIVVVPKETV